jgi:hypothetical protein
MSTPLLADLDNGSLAVSDGCVLSLPSLQSYWKAVGVSTTWSASGPGSTLVLGGLTNVVSACHWSLTINAANRGQVVLTNLSALDGAVTVQAAGTNSVGDLAAAQELSGVSLQTIDGGAILYGHLRSHPFVTVSCC